MELDPGALAASRLILESAYLSPFSAGCKLLSLCPLLAKVTSGAGGGRRALHVITPLNLKINLYFLIAGKG